MNKHRIQRFERVHEVEVVCGRRARALNGACHSMLLQGELVLCMSKSVFLLSCVVLVQDLLARKRHVPKIDPQRCTTTVKDLFERRTRRPRHPARKKKKWWRRGRQMDRRSVQVPGLKPAEPTAATSRMCDGGSGILLRTRFRFVAREGRAVELKKPRRLRHQNRMKTESAAWMLPNVL